MSAPVLAPSPPAAYLTGNAGLVPGEGHMTDFSGLPPPTDGEHIVQKFGPKIQVHDSQQVAQGFFEYSRCCGKRKALLIGINYTGSDNALKGCINDAKNMQKFLIDRFGYSNKHIVLLSDEDPDSEMLPTKANILRHMGWLVDDASRDDALFFHYSGHGTQIRDRALDEKDKYDEAIVPLDFKEAQMIPDDQSKCSLSLPLVTDVSVCGTDVHDISPLDASHERLVKPLPAGCRLTAVFDSCNSGSVMDIPYVYQPDSAKPIKEPKALRIDHGILHSLLAPIGQLISHSCPPGAHQEVFDLAKSLQIMKEAGASPADVVCWSGCRDDQTAADTFENGQAVGALSWAFITALHERPKQSYMELLTSIRALLQKRYSQIVQLSSCHPIDTSLEFVA